MHSFCVYNQSPTKCQGVDYLAQWLEDWNFVLGVLGSNPAGGGSFSSMPYFSSFGLSCRMLGALVRDRTFFRQKLALRHHR